MGEAVERSRNGMDEAYGCQSGNVAANVWCWKQSGAIC
jgi:hypothetical protein